MRTRNNKINKPLPFLKDTLVITGNGFDVWQGFNTRYSDFQKYYLEHRDEIMKKLKIKKKTYRDENGQVVSMSDVELIYGNPLDPNELDHDFWNSFESSLDQLEAEQINLYFGKKRHNLREMDKSIRNAARILKEAFCQWMATIEIDNTKSNMTFSDNCIFINFNYTDNTD